MLTFLRTVESARLTEVAAAVALSKQLVHTYLTNLVARGFVVRKARGEYAAVGGGAS